ncbi:peptidase S41 [sediment metagenome]|uniref:Peptidase S41 n=1 Tax=sediment metagenome TaxID=749907 RepID=D9PIH1_9ZZZZ
MERKEPPGASSLPDFAATPCREESLDRRQTHITFLLLGGLASLAFCGFVCVFGYYGEVVTAGIDKACAESAFQSGKRYEALGNLEGAVRQYRLALVGRFGDESHEHVCRLSLGDALVRLNRYEDAVEAYDQVPEMAFDRSGTFTGYVTALARSGEPEKAEFLGERWLGRARAEGDKQQVVWASSILGQLCEGGGRLVEAAAYYNEASTLNPSCEAGVRLAKLLRLQGRKQDALVHLDRFLTDAPVGPLREDAIRMREEIAAVLNAPDNASSQP